MTFDNEAEKEFIKKKKKKSSKTGSYIVYKGVLKAKMKLNGK